ncbi:hypothetical protein BAC3_02120 [uncultured bacterium]|nr:hypothetical protein BAC3_02120 [uncultured bacterium]
MAKRKTAQELREEAKRKIEAARKLERLENEKAKQQEEKTMAEIGKMVLLYRGNEYSGLTLDDLKKSVEKIVNGERQPVDSDAIKMTVPVLESEAEEDAA